MEGSLNASASGLQKVDQARKRRGWNRQSIVWAQSALTSVATLKQFWRGERISRDNFIQICQAVGIEDWLSIAEGVINASGFDSLINSLAPQTASPSHIPQIDWGEAPEITSFLGRESDLQTLQTWVEDRCKLIAILGMGGMGKTTIAVRLAETVQDQFDVIVWRSLRNAPTLSDILNDILQGVGEAEETRLNQFLNQFLQLLKDRRCLIILDNAESLLSEGPGIGAYHTGYEVYGELLRRVGEERHQSCLVLTSREPPRELPRLAGEKVKLLPLAGLSNDAGGQILASVANLTEEISPGNYSEIVAHYAGNPLALKIVAAAIRDLLDRDVATFVELLNQGSWLFSDIQDLLARHFDRLSFNEQEILYWLTIVREPIPLDRLKTLLLSPEAKAKLLETLDSLNRRSLLETSMKGYTLQPAVMEYALRRFLDRVSHGLITWLNQSHPEAEFNLPWELRHFPWLMATAPEFVREAQIKLILEPIADRLQSHLPTSEPLSTQILRLLPQLQGQPVPKVGYCGGSLVNLLGYLQGNLFEQDLSNLILWQVDLCLMALHGVNLSHSDLSHSALIQTFSNILSVAFSPDGKMLAQSDDNGWVIVWDISTRQPLAAWQAHPYWIFTVVFSSDGRSIACCSLDGTITVWDWQDLQQAAVPRPLNLGHLKNPNHPSHLSYSASPLSHPSRSSQPAYSQYQQQLFSHHTAGVSEILFHPSRPWLASCSADQTIGLVNLKSGEKLGQLTGHGGIVRTIAFALEGQYLLSGSLDQTVRLWDLDSQICCGQLVLDEPIYKIVVLPSAILGVEAVAVAGESGDIRIFALNAIPRMNSSQTALAPEARSTQETELLESQPLESQSLESQPLESQPQLQPLESQSLESTPSEPIQYLIGHDDRIWGMAVTYDGKLISSSDDRTVKLWNLQTGQCEKTFYGHQARIWSVAASAQGLIASGGDDRSVRLWHGQTHRRLHSFQGYHNAMTPVIFDGAELLTFSTDQIFRRWNLTQSEPIQQFPLPTQSSLQAALNPDRTLIASGNLDGTIPLCDGRTGQLRRTLRGHEAWVRYVDFSPDGQWLVSASGDQTLRLWNVATGSCQKILMGHLGPIQVAIFSPNGRQIASSSWDHTIRLWDIETATCLQVLDPASVTNRSKVGHRITALLFSQEGRYLIGAGSQAQVQIWDLQPPQPTCTVLPHPGAVALALHPTLPLLASASQNGTVKLWDLQTLDCRATWSTPTSYHSNLVFSEQGEFLAIGADNSTCTVWTVEDLLTQSSRRSPLVLRVCRPYENTVITGVQGLTEAQIATFIALGAIDQSRA
ncbi:NB-ARC domain-containing protein [Alkalinema pantanalense CENA528]|uniref:WD40 repeat domain-containing protein n=1 Tax=Alkalinema pantanalense TaxID=1620705 RepID=UPI003D702044